MPEQYHDELDQEVQQASSGGGIVCQVAVYGAFNVYAAGMPPGESIFLYGGNAGKKEDANAKAKALSESTGGRIEQTLCTVQYKDSVLGRDVSHWKDDRYHTYGPIWATDAKEFNARRIALGIKPGVKTWARMGGIVSPNCEENKEKEWAWEEYEGERRLKRIQLPVAVYASKSEAQDAADAMPAPGAENVGDESFPGHFDAATKWKPDDWDKAKPKLMELFKGGLTPEQIGAAMDAPAEAVKLALAQVEAK